MTNNKKPKGLQITLVGQSDSGKTNLLATVLNNPNCHSDMTIGPDRIANVGLGTRADDGANDDSVDKLMSYSDNILRGRVWTNPGTDEVRLYSCRLSYREAPQTQFRRGMFGQKTETTSHGEQTHLDFKIADGRGGDIAPNRFLNKDNPQDEEPIRRQQEYRDRLDESVGLIVVMPMDKDGFKIDLANRLVREIQRTIEFRKTAPDLPDLERVAICYTKYDELFTHRGASAGEKAGDANEAVDHLYNTAIVEVFRPLFAQAQQPDGFDICIFAVSTFGFVNGTGAANFYDLEESPGLLTRTVSADRDWANPNTPDIQNHFPFEMTENEAQSSWRPFNIAPPILFALTGRVTGPLYLDPDEVFQPEKREASY